MKLRIFFYFSCIEMCIIGEIYIYIYLAACMFHALQDLYLKLNISKMLFVVHFHTS
jgi:hypothetical protein